MERCKLPSWVLGQSLNGNRICILALKSDIRCHQFLLIFLRIAVYAVQAALAQKVPGRRPRPSTHTLSIEYTYTIIVRSYAQHVTLNTAKLRQKYSTLYRGYCAILYNVGAWMPATLGDRKMLFCYTQNIFEMLEYELT